MPLENMGEMLDDNSWIARDGEMVPHLEAKFVSDEYDRASLEDSITAKLRSVDVELPIGPLELQIAYKLHLDSPTDFEDALHLFTLSEESPSIPTLERWAETLGVEDNYGRLKHA